MLFMKKETVVRRGVTAQVGWFTTLAPEHKNDRRKHELCKHITGPHCGTPDTRLDTAMRGVIAHASSIAFTNGTHAYVITTSTFSSA